MEKKKLLFAIGTNSSLSDERLMLMKACVFRLFQDDIRFTSLKKTAPIGIDSLEFTNCLGMAYTALPLPIVKEEFKRIEQVCEDTADKRLANIIEMDIDILEYDGRRYHEKDWSRGYIIEMLNEAECLKQELL
ncbi:MAG: hypothetical protein SOZ80_04735 [Prevotella sp.]|uniref:hypothetical protein n=1 Tax=Prevotella sp. TaxID=59823 RepID=UPI002A30D0FB|nr:hypothetical protein [Prevotella sp.]MDD7319199.1 hypothetical protein [Prevotellaceae bacterium]MDY4020067.1 hypothetical protein [Prevotella sp.]